MNGETDVAGGRALEGVAIGCRVVSMLLLALMCALIVGQVVGRNLFDTGMPWADELARFCGVAIVFLCVPLLALRGQHVAVDMVPMLLPDPARRWVGLFAEILILAFAAIALWGLYAFLGRAWKFASPSLGIPNWVFYSPAIVGFFLLAVISAVRVVGLVRNQPLPQADKVLP
ncbi:TRAP transporter small permease [Mesorhizobium sp. CAU 1741]|uniref:TRAP transporter small permease n=1 Tax=Mesorhizobium sp. CAU 1741 TaxID=3140366 RepID=UPI00325A542A